MRDMRLSFWASVYGIFGLLFVLLSRILSAHLATVPHPFWRFSDPLNYLLTFASLILFLRAMYTASSATKEMRTDKGILRFMQSALILDIFFQFSAQVLQFTLNVRVTESKIVLAIVTLLSIPSLIGIFSLYFSKQLRGIAKRFLFGLFIASVTWVVLRLTEKVILPLCSDLAFLPHSLQSVSTQLCTVNQVLSFIIYILSVSGLTVYAYHIGKAAKKMPEKSE